MLGRRRGFLIPLSLLFLFILLFLEIGLYSLQQIAAENALDESERLSRLIGSEELYTNLGQAIETSKPSGPVTFNGDVNYTVPDSDLKLTAEWSKEQSVHRALPSLWADQESVLKREPELPEFSFTESKTNGSGVPPGHTRFQVKSNKGVKGSSVVSYSHLFPYGLYSPQGSVTAGSVSSFTNPVPYESEDKSKPLQLESGRPVNIYAKEDIQVADSYSSGLALSYQGNITLPSNTQGAVPLSGHSAPHNYWTDLFQQITTLKSTLSSRTLDKTEFLDDQLFTIAHLRDIFSGNPRDLLSIFSVGQACKVPFFPVPAIQDDAPLLIVFYIMHPYPVDFSGAGGDKEKSQRLAELAKQIQEKQDELQKRQQELAEEQAKKKPDQGKINDLKGQISTLQDDIKSLKDEVKKITKEMNDEKEDMANDISQAKIPQTAKEDLEQVTEGWSYLYVLGELFNIVKDLISGKDPFKDIFKATRVVHFGDKGPEWEWDGDTIDLRANLTVPRGRSLKIQKPQVKVRGDIYLQDGATLFIDGDLTLERPTGWTDFKGVPASEYGGYPQGRLLMEEGASLIVSGNIAIDGGNYNNGSVMLTSEYGPNKALTALIQAGGNITIRYGVMPAVTLGDLVDKLAETDSTLKGFNDDFFRPMAEQVFTVLGRLPYAGPWQWRKCYFAKYATTFEFVPALEEFGLGGPWPIPLPFDNCLVKIFNYFSILYAVELNAFTGENFYTHSPFWPMGRGVTPILLKVNPELVDDELKGLKWGKITLDALEEKALDFLKDDLPNFAVKMVRDVITEIFKQMVESEIPFKPPSCGSQKESEEKEIEQVVKEFLQGAIKEFGAVAALTFKQVLLTMKNSVYDNLESGEEKYSLYRQLPGLVVASGGTISIGEDDPSRLASGLFIARSHVAIESEKTVGIVISLEGNVSVQDFLHYPYFDRASFFNPKKYGDIFSSMVEFGDPVGSCAGDVSRPFPHRIAEGWK